MMNLTDKIDVYQFYNIRLVRMDIAALEQIENIVSLIPNFENLKKGQKKTFSESIFIWSTDKCNFQLLFPKGFQGKVPYEKDFLIHFEKYNETNKGFSIQFPVDLRENAFFISDSVMHNPDRQVAFRPVSEQEKTLFIEQLTKNTLSFSMTNQVPENSSSVERWRLVLKNDLFYAITAEKQKSLAAMKAGEMNHLEENKKNGSQSSPVISLPVFRPY